MQTTVGIIGGGPTGLLLSLLLTQRNIDNVVLEHRSRAYTEARVRAGQLDYASVEFLRRVGVGEGLNREGISQKGMNLRYRGATNHVDLETLTEGAYCTVYGQTSLTKELIATLVGSGHSPVYEVSDVQITTRHDELPTISYRKDGADVRLDCQYVIGCDGAHGVTRRYLNTSDPGFFQRLPFSWIGLLSDTPPQSKELTYVYHPEGFALWSMRSSDVSRTYLQCPREDTIADWSDDRFWTTFSRRLGLDADFSPGATTERVMVQMQGFVAPCMQRGRVALAGDAGHTVPPSAAKGLNMAIADVAHLLGALCDQLHDSTSHALAQYGKGAMERAWAGQFLSWRMTDLLHAPPDGNNFENEIKLTQLDSLFADKVRMQDFCNAYVGKDPLP